MVQFPTSNSAIPHLMIPLQHRQKSRRFRRWPSKWKNYEVPITGRKPRDPMGRVVVVFSSERFGYTWFRIEGWMLVNSGDFSRCCTIMIERFWHGRANMKDQNTIQTTKPSPRSISLQNPPFSFQGYHLRNLSWTSKLQVYGVESPQKSGDVQIRCDI